MKYIILLFVCCISVPALAQSKKFTYGPYVEMMIDKGKLPAASKAGLGGGLTAEIKVKSGLSITGSAGFLQFRGQSNKGNNTNIQVAPVRAGVKYNLPVPLLYIKAESGAAISSEGTRAIVTPGIGVHWKGLDVEAKYETWIKDNSYNQVGVKAAYLF